MPSVPIPFVVALLLLILLVRIARREEEAPASGPFMALIGACAVQSVLIGLRWGYGIASVSFVTPVLAAAVPPLVFISFGGLARTQPGQNRDEICFHVIAPLLLGILVIFWRELIDIALIAVYLLYALALIRLARMGPDALGRAKFEYAERAHRALWIAGAALAASAAIDAIVLLDFEQTRGRHAATIVGLANVVGLFALGLAAAVAGSTQPPPDLSDSGVTGQLDASSSEQDLEVISRVEDLMRTHELFRNPDFNLNRLARKAGLPARHISGAINRVRQENVSQYINGYRIAEACRLLRETDQQILPIMFEAGFQTKSNFNREFRRITGVSPKEWRQKNAGPA